MECELPSFALLEDFHIVHEHKNTKNKKKPREARRRIIKITNCMNRHLFQNMKYIGQISNAFESFFRRGANATD